MHCPECNTPNDQDAAFCIQCGKPIVAETKTSPAKSRRAYLFMFALATVLALVAGLGYYKFFLPDGIAAVVNGEEIRLSEVDAAVSRAQAGREATNSMVRYQTLIALIHERLALQEAHKAGMKVTAEELDAAVAEARASSDMDEAGFTQRIATQFGGMGAFKDFLEHQLLIDKFLDAKVVPPGADTRTSSAAVDRWMRDISEKASVRISLAEHGAGSGCGCCNKGGENSKK